MAPKKKKSRKTNWKSPVVKALKTGAPYLVFGILFGYFLSKSRATDYNSILNMFRFKEFQLYGVMIVSVALTAWGLFWMRFGDRSSKWKSILRDPYTWAAVVLLLAIWVVPYLPPASWFHNVMIPMIVAEIALVLFWVCSRAEIKIKGNSEWKPLKWDSNRLVGALLFGAGWAFAGTSPAACLAQIGEGKWMAFATLIGIAAGVIAYKKLKPRTTPNDQVW